MIRRLLVAVLLLTVAPFSFASKKEKKKEAPILNQVGFSYRQFQAPENYNWRGSNDRVITGIVWYPAEATADAKNQCIPPSAPLFCAGVAAKDAPLAPTWGRFPLIALSHGTGGSALQMGWLATYLAARGYIVVAVNHPGNNGATGYTPQGFFEWWYRARDLSVAISDLLADPRFGAKIDPDRIGAAGFSLGGYTMMVLAGAITDFHAMDAWCEMSGHARFCNIPEMPDVMARFNAMKQLPEVQQALKESTNSYRDPRIRAVFAIAPAIGHGVSTESLHQITIPVDIVVGAADPIAPAPDNAEIYAHNIPNAQLTILPGGVGHYTFLDNGTDAGKERNPQLFTDNPGVDRAAIHQQVAEMAADFFDQELAPVHQKKKK